MSQQPQGRPGGVLIIVAVVACLGLSACGGSTSSSTRAAASGSAGSGTAGNRTALAACLKQHGVTLPAGARGRGGGTRPPGTGFGGGPPSGAPGGGPRPGGPGGSKFRAALQACGASFRGRGAPSGRFHTAVVKYVACVRQHGYQLPNPNFSGSGPIFSRKIQTNAKFKAASKPCQSLLAPAGG